MSSEGTFPDVNVNVAETLAIPGIADKTAFDAQVANKATEAEATAALAPRATQAYLDAATTGLAELPLSPQVDLGNVTTDLELNANDWAIRHQDGGGGGPTSVLEGNATTGGAEYAGTATTDTGIPTGLATVDYVDTIGSRKASMTAMSYHTVGIGRGNWTLMSFPQVLSAYNTTGVIEMQDGGYAMQNVSSETRVFAFTLCIVSELLTGYRAMYTFVNETPDRSSNPPGDPQMRSMQYQQQTQRRVTMTNHRWCETFTLRLKPGQSAYFLVVQYQNYVTHIYGLNTTTPNYTLCNRLEVQEL